MASSLRVKTSWHSFPRTLLQQSSKLSASRKDWHAVWHARAGRSFVSEIFQYSSCTSKVYVSDALQKTGSKRYYKGAKLLWGCWHWMWHTMNQRRSLVTLRCLKVIKTHTVKSSPIVCKPIHTLCLDRLPHYFQAVYRSGATDLNSELISILHAPKHQYMSGIQTCSTVLVPRRGMSCGS